MSARVDLSLRFLRLSRLLPNFIGRPLRHWYLMRQFRRIGYEVAVKRISASLRQP